MNAIFTFQILAYVISSAIHRHISYRKKYTTSTSEGSGLQKDVVHAYNPISKMVQILHDN
jgi:hypothetical protein